MTRRLRRTTQAARSYRSGGRSPKNTTNEVNNHMGWFLKHGFTPATRSLAVALAVHPHGDVADACPLLEPSLQRPEPTVVRRQRTPGEAQCCSQKLAVLWSGYDYSMIWSARPSTDPPPQSPHSQMSPLSSSGEISKGLGPPSRGGGSGP